MMSEEVDDISVSIILLEKVFLALRGEKVNSYHLVIIKACFCECVFKTLSVSL